MKIVVEYGKHNLFSGVPIKLVIQSIEELYKRFEATKCLAQISHKSIYYRERMNANESY